MRPTLFVVTPPAAEPLSRTAAKLHLKVETSVTDDDALIDDLIKVARERAELVTGRQLLTVTYDLKAAGFPCADSIEVPRPPLRTVASITYVDTAGVVQTWAASKYQVLAPSGGPAPARGRLAPVYSESWPQVQPETLDAVRIRFDAGYGVATDVPGGILQAMKLMIGDWYEGREDRESISVSAMNLLTPFMSRETQVWEW